VIRRTPPSQAIAANGDLSVRAHTDALEMLADDKWDQNQEPPKL